MTRRVTESVQISATTLWAGELILTSCCWFRKHWMIFGHNAVKICYPRPLTLSRTGLLTAPRIKWNKFSEKNLSSTRLFSINFKQVYSFIFLSALNRIRGWQQYLHGSHIDLIYLGMRTIHYFLPDIAFLSSSFMTKC